MFLAVALVFSATSTICFLQHLYRDAVIRERRELSLIQSLEQHGGDRIELWKSEILDWKNLLWNSTVLKRNEVLKKVNLKFGYFLKDDT